MPNQPSPWDRFKDTFLQAAVHSPLGGGGLARAYYKKKGYSDADINRAIASLDADFEKKYKNAPVFQGSRNLNGLVTGNKPHGWDYVSPENIGRGTVSLLGHVLGGVDPTYALMPGRSIVGRVTGQAAVQGAASGARQGIEIRTGQRKKFSPKQVVEDAVIGAVFQGGGEGIGKAARAVKKTLDLPEVLTDEHIAPDGLPNGNAKGVRPIDPKTLAKIMNDPEAAGAHGINDNPPNRRQNNRDHVEVEAPELHEPDDILDSLPPANREYLEQRDNVQDIHQRDYGTGRSGYIPSDQGLPADIIENAHQFSPEHLADMKARSRQGENVTYDNEIRRADAEEDASPFWQKHDDVLTPFERQDMDASVTEPPSVNNATDRMENFSTDQASPPAANDPTRMDAVKGFVKNLMEDERGSLGDGSGPIFTRERPVTKEHGPFKENRVEENGDRYLHYTAANGEEIPIKMGIEPDGTAEISIDQFSTKSNRLGPKEIREAMYGLMDMYPEIKRFGGYRRSGAGAGRVQEIEPKGMLSRLMSDERGSLGPADGEDSVVGRLIKALKEAEPVRSSQERLYKKERGERISEAAQTGKFTSGEEGFRAELSKLGGEFSKRDFESVRQHFSQPEIDSLFDMVKDNPRLTFFEKINARSALSKMLAEGGTTVPTKSELKLLNEVFPEELTDALMKSPFKSKLSEHIANALNVPRSLMASMDFSAPGRQGIFLIGSKAYWKSFADMFRAFGSEKAYQAISENITARPSYKLMRQHGLALTNTGKKLSEREEAFMSQWAEKIPVAGRLVRASDRAYSGYLNKLRADTFDRLLNDAKKWADLDPHENPKAVKDIVRFVNAATGRGDLGQLNQAAPVLAGMFFSPRLMASRFQLLNPRFYAKLEPRIRLQALASMMTFGTTALTILGLAHAGGASVDPDPRSTDFGKIKIGNTRLDILGGFQPYLRAFAQIASGEKVNPTTREVTKLGKKYGSDTRLDVAEKFFENKAAPLASLALDLLRGKDAVGQPLDPKSMAAQRFIPLLAQDMYDVYNDTGAEGVAKYAGPAAFGIGVQTYTPKGPKAKKPKDEFKSSEFKDEFKSKSEFEDGF